MPELDRPAVDLDGAARRPDRAGEGAEQLVLALSFERDDAGDLAVPEVERDIVELGADAEVADAEARLDRPQAGRASPLLRTAARAFSIRAPSISSTIRSSAPGAMSTTPTVSPSRSTVARSQSAEISMKRCEMKMTERPVLALAADDVEHPFGEVGGQRGGHLVEQQHVRLDRQRAREVEHAQHRERQVAGGLADIEIGDAELADPVEERLHRRAR